MAPVRITLPSGLTGRQLRVVLKYFEKTDRLTPTEWRVLLGTIDELAGATVTTGRRQLTFQQVYDHWVDRHFAGQFIQDLLALKHPETEAEALQQRTTSAVLDLLEREGLYHENAAGSEYLAAYCLYWWSAFAQGYRFEWEVFQDLRASGIAFQAHDLRDPVERRSACDLVVSRQRGDLKNTTYFLHAARTRPLNCDFYVTRLYDPRRRRYVRVVVLREIAWRAVDGGVEAATLDTAADYFPVPVQIPFGRERFVIVPYDIWKAKVKQRQHEEGRP